ncbi:MAG: glycosyltransferase, partial [Planctomycetota bacterium]
MTKPEVSVVIPVSRRAGDLGRILVHVREGTGEAGDRCEVVMVVDGDQPGKLEEARRLAEQDPSIRLLQFARSFGEGAALRAGLLAANAPVLVTHPAYFQVEAAALPRLLREIEAGADVAFASRLPGRESWLNRVQRWGFNVLLRRLIGTRFRDVACGVRALRREALEEIGVYGGFHRFLVVAAVMRGLTVREVDAAVHPEARGARLYNLVTYLQRLLDIGNVFFLAKFTHRPLRFFGLIGAAVFVVGVGICVWVSFERLFLGVALGERPLFLLGVLLAALGFQTLALGLLGELITFSQAAQSKPYI